MPKPTTVDASQWLNEQLADPKIAGFLKQEKKRLKIADAIYEAREEAGLTQSQLAEMVGTSQPAIARLESADYSRPSYRTLEKIAEALGLELEVTLKAPKAPRKTTIRKQTLASPKPI